MAFKMKGFPYSGESPIKGKKVKDKDGNETHPGEHTTHHPGEFGKAGKIPSYDKKGHDGHHGDGGFFMKSAFQQKVDPEVKYEDLDEKGKRLWHKVRGTEYKPSKESNKEKDE